MMILTGHAGKHGRARLEVLGRKPFYVRVSRTDEQGRGDWYLGSIEGADARRLYLALKRRYER